MVRKPGFEPGSQPWQGRILDHYTTPASINGKKGALNKVFCWLEAYL